MCMVSYGWLAINHNDPATGLGKLVKREMIDMHILLHSGITKSLRPPFRFSKIRCFFQFQNWDQWFEDMTRVYSSDVRLTERTVPGIMQLNQGSFWPHQL